MTILWGTDFPKFYLCTRRTQEDSTTGDGTTTQFTFTLANAPVLKKQVTVVVTVDDTEAGTLQDDGAGVFPDNGSVRGTIDYTTGQITIEFATAPASGAAIVFDTTYYSIDQTVDFAGAGVLDRDDIEWTKEILYDLVLETGERKQLHRWRGRFTIHILEVDAYTYTDSVRLLATWRNEGQREVVMFPRPGNLPGYFVIPDSDFNLVYPDGLWKAEDVTLRFITKNRFENIPGHTGAEGDTLQ